MSGLVTSDSSISSSSSSSVHPLSYFGFAHGRLSEALLHRPNIPAGIRRLAPLTGWRPCQVLGDGGRQDALALAHSVDRVDTRKASGGWHLPRNFRRAVPLAPVKIRRDRAPFSVSVARYFLKRQAKTRPKKLRCWAGSRFRRFVASALEVELPEERRQSGITVWETKIVETDDPRWIASEKRKGRA